MFISVCTPLPLNGSSSILTRLELQNRTGNTGENNRVNNLNAEADAAGDDEDDVGVVTFPCESSNIPLAHQVGRLSSLFLPLGISAGSEYWMGRAMLW
ncbi:hypothetical protein HS088_TW03G00978 [Tripterygium wilfordii]|uniref:Uncharacterized protein n=1 Tax=Tripterygium wilfordii TaxID=458696 RepID=A0A7J7DWH1_TRIWF|nr:hypothetical protein HS088_TW03G00978 [Tripterygium wilfordii]